MDSTEYELRTRIRELEEKMKDLTDIFYYWSGTDSCPISVWREIEKLRDKHVQ